MNRATEQEAYELPGKPGIPFQKVGHPAITSVKNILFSSPGPQVKNLLLESRRRKKIYLAILPDEKHAGLKQLVEQLKEKHLSFASEEQLPDLLGIPADTMTPLALMRDTEKKIWAMVDSAIDRQDTVGFHPNIGTTMLIMDFSGSEKTLVYLEHLLVYENL